jgi:hypothetical protein
MQTINLKIRISSNWIKILSSGIKLKKVKLFLINYKLVIPILMILETLFYTSSSINIQSNGSNYIMLVTNLFNKQYIRSKVFQIKII